MQGPRRRAGLSQLQWRDWLVPVPIRGRAGPCLGAALSTGPCGGLVLEPGPWSSVSPQEATGGGQAQAQPPHHPQSCRTRMCSLCGR